MALIHVYYGISYYHRVYDYIFYSNNTKRSFVVGFVLGSILSLSSYIVLRYTLYNYGSYKAKKQSKLLFNDSGHI